MNSSTMPAPALPVQNAISEQEIERGLQYLNQTQGGVIGAIKGMSGAQWGFTPAPGCWSVAQIVEHLTFVLERVGGPLMETLAHSPAPPAGRDYKYIDAIVIHQFPSRLAKYPAPEFAMPGGRFASPLEAHAAVRNSYARLAERLKSTPDLREHALEALPLKAVSKGAYDVMDGYQWILAAAAHAERHTKQILEVKADENFPVE